MNSSRMDAAGLLPLGAPPINNACLPTIYNKLDADAVETTRVRNSFLDHSLRFQQKLIEKYHIQAMRLYVRERNKLRKDMGRIVEKLPNLEDMTFFEERFQYEKRQKKKPTVFKAYSTKAMGFNGIPTEKENKPFCDRFFCHHIPSRPKFKRHQKLPPLLIGDTENGHPISRSLIMSKKLSISDNVLATRDSKRSQPFENLSYDVRISDLLRDDDAVTI